MNDFNSTLENISIFEPDALAGLCLEVEWNQNLHREPPTGVVRITGRILHGLTTDCTCKGLEVEDSEKDYVWITDEECPSARYNPESAHKFVDRVLDIIE